MSKTNPAVQLRTSKGLVIELDDELLADAVAEVSQGEAKIVNLDDEIIYDQQAVVS